MSKDGSAGELAYDFFIAHAGADTPIAERLYDFLAAGTRVFLDTRSLAYGDEWDIVLPRAQRQSRITIVIVSQRTDAAFYQREEVAAAIELARREDHRVVPLFADGAPTDFADIPYGLRRLHRAELSDRFTLEDFAARLRAQIDAAAPAPAPSPGQVRPDVASVDADHHAFSPNEHVEISALLRVDETLAFLELAVVPDLVEARVGQSVIGALAVTTKRLAFITSPPIEDAAWGVDVSLEFDAIHSAVVRPWSSETGTRLGAVVVSLASGKTRSFALFREQIAPKVAAYINYRVAA